jgi:hypothetical protein
MPVRVDASTATQRWSNGMANSGQAMTRGVQAVRESPGARAAQAADKWLQRTTAARDKFARRVGALTLASWQNSMTQYGISRAAQGAQQKQGKFQGFMAEFIPHLQAGIQQIETMPKNTLEDGINRAVAMIRHNAQFQRGAGA